MLLIFFRFKNHEMSKLKFSSSLLNLPVELIVHLRDANSREDLYISKSIIQFYNLAPTHSTANDSAALVKTKLIINYLNFIRFTSLKCNLPKPTPNSNNNLSTSSSAVTAGIQVPCFSLILLTNNLLLTSNLGITQAKSNLINLNNWSYLYKVELNDDHGCTLARQLFYKLNNPSKIPLCCNSNWISPLSAPQSPRNQTKQHQSVNSNKYIIRLNLNCKNYDLMLFFYRLLFSKYPNYSKKNFTLFVLLQNEHQNSTEQEPTIIEFQLSLKHDPNVILENLNKSNVTPMTLVHNIYDQAVFNHLVGLLDGFLEEVVKNKVYSIYDPDQNRVYLINKSGCAWNKSGTPAVSAEFRFFNSTGLGEKFNSSVSRENSRAKQKRRSAVFLGNAFLNSPYAASNLNSPSETASYDSSKDSGNWSYTSFNNHSAAKTDDGFNYKELHLVKNTSSSSSCPTFNSSVKNLIKKFNTTLKLPPPPEVINSNYARLCNYNYAKMKQHLQQQSTILKKKQNSEEDEDYDEDEDEDESETYESDQQQQHSFNLPYDLKKNDSELKLLLQNSINSSIHTLNALKQKNSRARCSSALNEPYTSSTPINNQNVVTIVKKVKKGGIKRYEPGFSKENVDGINGGALKKSKSVTFLDSIDQIEKVNAIIDQRIQSQTVSKNKSNMNGISRNSLSAENNDRMRSKSTVPFMYSSSSCSRSDFDYYEDEEDEVESNSSYLIECVDENVSDNEQNQQQPRPRNNSSRYKNIYNENKYKNCLIEPKLEIRSRSNPKLNLYMAENCVPPADSTFKSNLPKPTVNVQKPNVGITPETRFRRAHTLNMVRNSRMPLPCNSRQHEQQPRNQKIYTSFHNKYPVAKF